MNIPGYDAWLLAGPDEHPEPEMMVCGSCDGDGTIERENTVWKCGRCGGSGEVAVDPEAPDTDYLYEKARDERMDE